jgi:beta-xylosidase
MLCRKSIQLFAFAIVALVASAQVPPKNPAWLPDNGDGSYTNPIIHADYSDPDLIRVGDDFYLTASSFNTAPGLPILHSKDLVNWKIIAHVFQQQVPRSVFAQPQHGNGVWAPAIRWHKGQFYIFYGDPDFGIYMVKAWHPAGPWSEPRLIRAAKGWIDPCPFWDDNGDAYLVHGWANSRSGIKSILTLNRMSTDGTRLLDEGKMIFDGRQHHPTIEGPKLYKKNGYYYIFAPAGGVATGWQTVLRARNIYGPYEDRIVMDQGRTKINGPHQGGWVETRSGESWFVHFQDKGAYGRILHLQPLQWLNDWPLIGMDHDGDGKGEPVSTFRKPKVRTIRPIEAPQTTDEFGTSRPGLQWQWQANYENDWFSLTTRRGWLRLRTLPRPPAAANLWSVPNLILQKFPASEFTVTTRVDAARLAIGDRAGLVVMGLDYSYLALEKTPTGLHVSEVVCQDADKGSSERQRGGADTQGLDLYLRVVVTNGAICRFSYSHDGVKFRALNDESFTARPGKWIGAKVGLFSLREFSAAPEGYADFDWFRIERTQ